MRFEHEADVVLLALAPQIDVLYLQAFVAQAEPRWVVRLCRATRSEALGRYVPLGRYLARRARHA